MCAFPYFLLYLQNLVKPLRSIRRLPLPWKVPWFTQINCLHISLFLCLCHIIFCLVSCMCLSYCLCTVTHPFPSKPQSYTSAENDLLSSENTFILRTSAHANSNYKGEKKKEKNGRSMLIFINIINSNYQLLIFWRQWFASTACNQPEASVKISDPL